MEGLQEEVQEQSSKTVMMLLNNSPGQRQQPRFPGSESLLPWEGDVPGRACTGASGPLGKTHPRALHRPSAHTFPLPTRSVSV